MWYKVIPFSVRALQLCPHPIQLRARSGIDKSWRVLPQRQPRPQGEDQQSQNLAPKQQPTKRSGMNTTEKKTQPWAASGRMAARVVYRPDVHIQGSLPSCSRP